MTRVFALLLAGALTCSGAAFALPANAERFVRQADEAGRRGDLLSAMQLYQSAIVQAPAEPEPYHRLAQLYADHGDAILASKFYGIALEINPTYAPSLKGLALLELSLGDLEGARMRHEHLVNACANCPETVQVEKALDDWSLALDRNKTPN